METGFHIPPTSPCIRSIPPQSLPNKLDRANKTVDLASVRQRPGPDRFIGVAPSTSTPANRLDKVDGKPSGPADHPALPVGATQTTSARLQRAPALIRTTSSFRVSIGLPKRTKAPPGLAPSRENAAAAVRAQFARQINAAHLNAFGSIPPTLDGFSAAHAATGLVAAVEGRLCSVNRSIEGFVNGSQVGAFLRLFGDWPEASRAAEADLFGEGVDPCLPEPGMEDTLAAALAEAAERTGETPASLLSAASSAASVLTKAFGSPERYLALRLGRIRLLRRIFGLLATPAVGEVLIPLLVEKSLLSVAAAGEVPTGEFRRGCEVYVENLFSFSLSLIDEYEKIVASELPPPSLTLLPEA